VRDVRKMANADHDLLARDRHGNRYEKQSERCEGILQ
jgi:hypothetical protein